jgi:hypothetical protein
MEQRRPEVEARDAVLPPPCVEPPALLELPGVEALQRAYAVIRDEFDPRFGGFGGAPKFPQAPTLEFLLRLHDEPWAPEALPMVVATLRAMASGGIRDHVGGGFARYSVDWAVPIRKDAHDNAQLLRPMPSGGGRRSSWRPPRPPPTSDGSGPPGGFLRGTPTEGRGTFYVFTHE